nr:type II toxin-antitoxin system RelE/ParE family toxin [Candidatus Thiosymbion oneisti]
MIKSFRCKHTEALFRGKPRIRFRSFQSVAERKLQMLDIARRIDDMRLPPANRLEALKGDRRGQWNIRINDQWRLCFRFTDGNAYDAEIVDYH